MGILLGHGLRVGDPHVFEHLHHHLGGFLLAHILMDNKRLAHLALNRKDRVQARHRLLENNGNLIPTDFAHILNRHIRQVPPVKNNFPAVNIAVPIQ